MKKKKQGIVITSVLLVCLIFVVVGVSFAFFTYSRQGSKENTITTGSLTFVYDEQKAEGNGITLSNAFPMSDDEGKGQSGDNNVFDFQVLATTQGESISYEVIGKKEDSSTLPENVTKIYLTTLSGSEETEVATTVKDGVVTTYDELSDTQIEDQTGKTLYQEVIPLNQTGYQKNFRLRMWLSEEAETTDPSSGSWDYNNQTFTIRINVVANGERVTPPAVETEPNAPELVEGMIPVTYNGTNWVKADTSSEWYNYDNQEWANAVTVTETNRATYMSAPAGTEILMEDINTMWVWIPRYEYMYTNLGDQYAGGTQDLPGEIKVNFLSGTSTTPSDAVNYKVHPAFTFGTDQLTGLWYAKFETSILETCTPNVGDINTGCDVTTFTLQIKPNVTSWRGARVSTFFQSIRGMQTDKYATYGFANDTSYNIHMSKNSEWAAVAYLSQSKYGKYGNPNYEGVNKEIYQNKSDEYITGMSNGTPSIDIVNTQVTYDTPDTGYGASTTGTIYGVYDMSGGTWEHVMANYNNTIASSGFQSLPEEKYYDIYITQSDTVLCNSEPCYGHALDETSGWYNDAKWFIVESFPWIGRGAGSDNSIAGVFYFGLANGSPNVYNASRSVLTS